MHNEPEKENPNFAQPTIEEQMTAIEKAQREATPTRNPPIFTERDQGGMNADAEEPECARDAARVPTDSMTED